MAPRLLVDLVDIVTEVCSLEMGLFGSRSLDTLNIFCRVRIHSYPRIAILIALSMIVRTIDSICLRRTSYFLMINLNFCPLLMINLNIRRQSSVRPLTCQIQPRLMLTTFHLRLNTPFLLERMVLIDWTLPLAVYFSSKSSTTYLIRFRLLRNRKSTDYAFLIPDPLSMTVLMRLFFVRTQNRIYLFDLVQPVLWK